jgi:hypothetical protein
MEPKKNTQKNITPTQLRPGSPEASGAAQPSPASEGVEGTDEFGGRGGLDPTRFDDWEINGKCVDF